MGLTQQKFVKAIETAMTSGQNVTFCDIEFSRDDRFASKRKYSETTVPFDLHIKNRIWRGVHFKDSSISGLAFTGTTLEGCTFENCLLAIQNWRSRYIDCRFISSDLRSFSFSSDQEANRNSFERVAFEKCNMQGRSMDYAQFQYCAFSNSKLDRVEFRQAILSDSSFAGKLKDVVFGRDYTEKPTQIRNADFRKAIVSYCIFPNAHVSGVTAPENPRIHVIPRYTDLIALIDQARHVDPEIGDISLASIFTSDYRPDVSFGILNESDLKALLKPKGIELLSRILDDQSWHI